MALHDELAELRAHAGPQVFEDPVAFRAAFDDFVPEGSASTGEISLLVGAIATGALQRLTEQLRLGADPETSIAAQGDLLARDRGTTETGGARWALSVLAHALGDVPAALVPTRPTPGPEGAATAGRPRSSVPTVVATRTEPLPPQPSERRTHPLLVAAVVGLAIVAVAAVALLVLRDSDGDAAADRSPTPSAAGGSDEEVLAELDMSEAGKTVRVQLVHDDTAAFLVLLAARDGEYAEVERHELACPYLDTSYDAGIQDQGGRQIFWGWQERGAEGYGEYGEVQIDEEKLIPFGLGDQPCPGEG